jgi:hypothetical protein
LIFGTKAGSDAAVNGEKRRFGGIGDGDEEFVWSDVGDAIAAANTLLQLDSHALQRALGHERALHIAKRLAIGEVYREKNRGNHGRIKVRRRVGIASARDGVGRAKGSLQGATKGTFIHKAFEHVVHCPHLKTSGGKFLIGGVSEKD